MATLKEGLQFQVDSDYFGEWPGFGGIIERSVLPLWTVVEGQYRHLGTGFIINQNGLMMTAKHVLEEGARHATRRLNEKGEYYDHWELYAIYVSDEPNNKIDDSDTTIGGPLQITQIYTPDALDIALCWLRPLQNIEDGSFLTFPTVRLSARIPSIGEHVIGVGYYGQIETKRTGESLVVDWDRQKRVTTGTVVETLPNGRDASMLNFPCFRLDTRFEGGMSGGPIFGEDGYACGVICSGMPPTEGDSTYLSYGSLVRPAFGISIQAIISPNTVPETMFLYDFAVRGFIETDETFHRLKFQK